MALRDIVKPSDAANVAIPVESGESINFLFDTSQTSFERVEADLVLSFDDGTTVTLEGFFLREEDAELPNLVLEDGFTISAADFLLALNPEFDLAPAAGPAGSSSPNSSGTRAYAENAGNLMDGIGRLDGLDIGFDGEAAPERDMLSSDGGLMAGLTTEPDDSNRPGPNPGPDPGPDPGPGPNPGPEPNLPHHARLIVTNAEEGSGFSFYAQDIEGNLITDPNLIDAITFINGGSEFFTVSIDSITGMITITLTEAGKTALAAGEKFDDILVITVDGEDYVVDLLGSGGDDSYDYVNRENETNFGDPLTGEWYASHGKLVFDEKITLGGIGYNQADVINTQTGETTALQDSQVRIVDGKASLVNLEAVSQNDNAYGLRTSVGSASSIIAGEKDYTDSTVTISAQADTGSAYGVYAQGDTSIDATHVIVTAEGKNHSAGIQNQNGAQTSVVAEDITIAAASSGQSATGVWTEGTGSKTELRAQVINVSASAANDTAYGIFAGDGASNLLVGSNEAGNNRITITAGSEKSNAKGMYGDSQIHVSGSGNEVSVSATTIEGHANGLEHGAGVTVGAGNNNTVDVSAQSRDGRAIGLDHATIDVKEGNNNTVNVTANSVHGAAVGLDQGSRINMGDGTGNSIDIQAHSTGGGDAHGMYGGTINAGTGSYDITVNASSDNGSGQISGMLSMGGNLVSSINIEEGHGSTVDVSASTNGSNWVSGMYGASEINIAGGRNNTVNVSATSTGTNHAYGMWGNESHGRASIDVTGENNAINVRGSATEGDAYGMSKSDMVVQGGGNTVNVSASTQSGYAAGMKGSTLTVDGGNNTVTVNAESGNVAAAEEHYTDAIHSSVINSTGENNTLILNSTSGANHAYGMAWSEINATGNNHQIAVNVESTKEVAADQLGNAQNIGLYESAINLAGTGAIDVDVTSRGEESMGMYSGGNGQSTITAPDADVRFNIHSDTGKAQGMAAIDPGAHNTINAASIDIAVSQNSADTLNGQKDVGVYGVSARGNAANTLHASGDITIGVTSGAQTISDQAERSGAYGLEARDNGSINTVTAGGKVTVDVNTQTADAYGMFATNGGQNLVTATEAHIAATSVSGNAYGMRAEAGSANTLTGADDNGGNTLSVSAQSQTGNAQAMYGQSEIHTKGSGNEVHVAAASQAGNATGILHGARINVGDGDNNAVTVTAESTAGRAIGVDGATIQVGNGDKNSVVVQATSAHDAAVALDQGAVITIGNSTTVGDREKANSIDIQAHSGSGNAHGMYGATIEAGRGTYDINVEASVKGDGQISGMLGMEDANITSAITIEEGHNSRVNVAASTEGDNWVSGMYGASQININSGSGNAINVSAQSLGSGDAFGMWSGPTHGTATINVGDGDNNTVTVTADANTGDAYGMFHSAINVGDGIGNEVTLGASSKGGDAYGALSSTVTMGAGGSLKVNAASDQANAAGLVDSTVTLGQQNNPTGINNLNMTVEGKDSASGLVDSTVSMYGTQVNTDIHVTAAGAATGMDNSDLNLHGSTGTITMQAKSTQGSAVAVDNGSSVNLHGDGNTMTLAAQAANQARGARQSTISIAGDDNTATLSATGVNTAVALDAGSRIDVAGDNNIVDLNALATDGRAYAMYDASMGVEGAGNALNLNTEAQGEEYAIGMFHSRIDVDGDNNDITNTVTSATNWAMGMYSSEINHNGTGTITIDTKTTDGEAISMYAYALDGEAPNGNSIDAAQANVILNAHSDNGKAQGVASFGANATNMVNAQSITIEASQNNATSPNGQNDVGVYGVSARAGGSNDLKASGDITITAASQAGSISSQATDFGVYGIETKGQGSVNELTAGGTMTIGATSNAADAYGVFSGAGGETFLNAEALKVTAASNTGAATGMEASGEGSRIAVEATQDISVTATSKNGSATGLRVADYGNVTLSAGGWDETTQQEVAGNITIGAHATHGQATGIQAEENAYASVEAKDGGTILVEAHSDKGTASGVNATDGGSVSLNGGSIAVDVMADGHAMGIGATGEESTVNIDANGQEPDQADITVTVESGNGAATGISALDGATVSLTGNGNISIDAQGQGEVYGIQTANSKEEGGITINAGYDDGKAFIRAHSSDGTATGISALNSRITVEGKELEVDVNARGDAKGIDITDSNFQLGGTESISVTVNSHEGAATGISITGGDGSIQTQKLDLMVTGQGDAMGMQVEDSLLDQTNIEEMNITASSAAGTATGLHMRGSSMGTSGFNAGNITLDVDGETGATGMYLENITLQSQGDLDIRAKSDGGEAAGLIAQGAKVESNFANLKVDVTAEKDATGIHFKDGASGYLGGGESGSVVATSKAGNAYALRSSGVDEQGEGSHYSLSANTIKAEGAASAYALLAENGAHIELSGVGSEELTVTAKAGSGVASAVRSTNSGVEQESYTTVRAQGDINIEATSAGSAAQGIVANAYGNSSSRASNEVESENGDVNVTVSATGGDAIGVWANSTHGTAENDIKAKNMNIDATSTGVFAYGLLAESHGSTGEARNTLNIEDSVTINAQGQTRSYGTHTVSRGGSTTENTIVAGGDVTITSTSTGVNNGYPPEAFGMHTVAEEGGNAAASIDAGGTVSITATNSALAYGMSARTTNSTGDGNSAVNTITANSVEVTADASGGNNYSYAMAAQGAGALNVIEAADSGTLFKVVLTAKSGDALDKAYAMWASNYGGNIINAGDAQADITLNGTMGAWNGASNQIITGKENDTVTINGSVVGGNNSISTGAGDDTIILNGAVAKGALTIDAGEGDYDTLILTAGSAEEFAQFYQAWLQDLADNGLIDGMNIDAVWLHLEGIDNLDDFVWLFDVFAGADFSIWDSVTGQYLDLDTYLNTYMGDSDISGASFNLFDADDGLGIDMALFGDSDEVELGYTLNLDGADESALTLSTLMERADGFGVIDLQGESADVFTMDSLLDGLMGSTLDADKLVGDGNIDIDSLTNGTVLRIHGDSEDTVTLGQQWSSEAIGSVTYDGEVYVVYEANITDDPQYLLMQAGLATVA